MPESGLALNEGRGINPGDTANSRLIFSNAMTAQRRPGHKPRRHGVENYPMQESDKALNEGRGINPGDTFMQVLTWLGFIGAQRRPGHKPRRHVPYHGGGGHYENRSTKAGA